MTAPNANTFELTPPRRPTAADFNDIVKEDDGQQAPNPQTMPNAAEWNTIEHLLLALGRVAPLAVFTVTGGGSPSIASVVSTRSDVTVPSFTITRTGAGDVSITWPSGTFPASVSQPIASLTAAFGMIYAANITNGVRVHTADTAGSDADKSFTVAIF